MNKLNLQDIIIKCKAELISNIKINIVNNIQKFMPITCELKKIEQEDIHSINNIMFSQEGRFLAERENFVINAHNFLGGCITEIRNNEEGQFFIEINYNYTKVDNLYLVGGFKTRDIIQRQKGNMYIAEPGLFWNGWLEYSFTEPKLTHIQV